jgi:hypothetical protein
MKQHFVLFSLFLSALVLCGTAFAQEPAVSDGVEIEIYQQNPAPEPNDPEASSKPVPVPELPVQANQAAPEANIPSQPTSEAADQTEAEDIGGLSMDSEPEPELQVATPATKKTPTGPVRLKFPGVDNVLLDPPLPAHKAGETPSSAGDTTGNIYIGHRAVVEKYNGWGWIKKESDSWNKSKWATIREVPGAIIVPGRYLKHPDNDANIQYRLYGEFSNDKAYEPNKDVFVDVFILKGFEVIGPASQPSGVSLPKGASAPTRSKPTTGGARTNPFGR